VHGKLHFGVAISTAHNAGSICRLTKVFNKKWSERGCKSQITFIQKNAEISAFFSNQCCSKQLI